ncbi:MAG TPA: DUF192 domain-containing protein [Acidobacteriota bacterium]|nr:DUF192 domain-containing protein [Acidobacteriota bacterium]
MKRVKYIVLNRTRGVCLADDAEKACSVFSRMKGLIGRTAAAFPPGTGLWIDPTDGIHTFGMRMPIDAAYLDDEGRVLRVYHALKPWRVGAIMPRARSVLELPAGTLARARTEVGDILEFRKT